MPDLEGKRLTQELIDWADVILVMERLHEVYVRARFRRVSGKIHVLKIVDRYYRDDPELKRALQKKVPGILENY